MEKEKTMGENKYYNTTEEDFVNDEVWRDGYRLKNHPQYQDNKRIVETAYLSNPNSLRYAHESLLADADFLISLANKDFHPVIYECSSIKDNKEFLLKMASYPDSSDILSVVPKELFKDEELIIEVVKNSSAGGINFHSENLKLILDNENIMKEMAKKNVYCLSISNTQTQLLDDDKTMLEAAKSGQDVLRYCSDRLKDDKQIVLEAVKHYPNQFCLCSERLRGDLEVAKEATSAHTSLLKHCSDELKDNTEFVQSLLDKDMDMVFIYRSYKEMDKMGSACYQYISDRLKDKIKGVDPDLNNPALALRSVIEMEVISSAIDKKIAPEVNLKSLEDLRGEKSMTRKNKI